MKCPKCGGNAELSNWGSYIDPDYADFHVECEKCGYHSMGSTDPQKAKEMFEKGMGMYYTNEAWIKQCTTEQLAEFLNLIIRVGPYENEPKDFWEHVYGRGGEHGAKSIVEWLKQPHSEVDHGRV